MEAKQNAEKQTCGSTTAPSFVGCSCRGETVSGSLGASPRFSPSCKAVVAPLSGTDDSVVSPARRGLFFRRQ
jgi:hypothetical protein